MKKWILPFIFGMVVLLAACVPAAAAPTPTIEEKPASQTAAGKPTAAAQAESTTSDPFTYCAKVINIDRPNSSYSGPKMPGEIVQGLLKVSGASSDIPADVITNGSSWRCMDGKVYACFIGANLPCAEKANSDKTPSPAENDYCQANPGGDFIPAVVTGHNTIYEWQCQGDKAAAGKQVFHSDARGFIAEIWYPIAK
jgi:hypothetical protein